MTCDFIRRICKLASVAPPEAVKAWRPALLIENHKFYSNGAVIGFATRHAGLNLFVPHRAGWVILVLMKSVSPDPFRNEHIPWKRMRWHLRWVMFEAFWAGALGLLNANTKLGRYWRKRMKQNVRLMQQALHSLLILSARNTPKMSCRPKARSAEDAGTQPATLRNAEGWVPASARLTPLGGNDGGVTDPSEPRLYSPASPHAPPRPKRDWNAWARIKLNALAAIFADPTAQIARVARTLAAQGCRSVRRAVRPGQGCARQLDLAASPSSSIKGLQQPAVIDTS